MLRFWNTKKLRLIVIFTKSSPIIYTGEVKNQQVEEIQS